MPQGPPTSLERALGESRARWEALAPPAAPETRTLLHAQARLGEAPIYNAFGLPLRAVKDVPRSSHYEAALLFQGRMAFRPGSSHDWFNLLSWQVWPLAKAALNLRHTLHYLGQVARHTGEDPLLYLGARVPRDGWMQNLANLDEGGCVARAALVEAHTVLDEVYVRHWTSLPDAGALQKGFRWFGHAVLELLHTGRPVPRMWIAILEEPTDEALARRILTFSPGLEPELAPLVERIDQMEQTGKPGALQPFYRAAVRFAPGDPFVKPFQSIWPPWAQPISTPSRTPPAPPRAGP